MHHEYELISCSKLKDINLFFSKVSYRNCHVHKEYELLCLIDGLATIHKKDKSINIKKGDILLVHPYEPHEIDTADKQATFLIIQVSNHFLHEYTTIQSIVFEKSVLTDTMNSEQKKFIWDILLSTASVYLSEGKMFGAKCLVSVTNLVCHFLKYVPYSYYTQADFITKQRLLNRINRITLYIENNYEKEIHLNDIAKLERITPTYVSQFFTKNFGITFQEYLNNIRFEHALRLLSSTNLSLYNIAISSGFSDPKYLTKISLKKLGCTAKELRKRINEKITENTQNSILDYRLTTEESKKLLDNTSFDYFDGLYSWL